MPGIRTQPSFQNPNHAGRARSGLARRSAATGATQHLFPPEGLWQLSAALPRALNPKEHPRSWSSHPVTPQMTSKFPELLLWSHGGRTWSAAASPACATLWWGSPLILLEQLNLLGPLQHQVQGEGCSSLIPASSILLPECGPYCGTSQSHPQEGDTEADRVLGGSQRVPTLYPNTPHPKAGSSCALQRGLSPQSGQ